MDHTIILTVQGMLAAVCWLIVAGAAGLAVFAPGIRDTVLERIGLSAVSLAAVGAACRIVASGWESRGDLALAGAMAFYVGAVALKHVRGRA